MKRPVILLHIFCVLLGLVAGALLAGAISLVKALL